MLDDITKIWIVAFGVEPDTARVFAWVSIVLWIVIVGTFFFATFISNLAPG